MARKASSDADSTRGFGDIIGVALLAGALLLLVAQLSFDPKDLETNQVPSNHSIHNWIGPVGATVAYGTYFVMGFTAYLLPVFAGLFGMAYWLEALSYLKRRWPWAVILLVSCMGWLHLMDLPHMHDKSSFFTSARNAINAPSAGGFVGMALYDYLFWMLGPIGSGIAYGTLDLISLLFLTNFQLGEWVRTVWHRRLEDSAVAAQKEEELARKAKELEKQAKKLQDEVDRSTPDKEKEKSGLGADMQPVPEPTVRDLSLPQAPKPGARPRKSAEPEKEKEFTPMQTGDVIKAHEITAATTSDILGRPPEPLSKPEEAPVEEKNVEAPAAGAEEAAEPAPAPAKPKYAPRKPKPITVASTPMIGNYQLPSYDFLQLPDLTLKPTESKEELMANARLMQQTLAQFDIDVALGDITKGPTITRYELHPAPGVRLEKITALTNNIAAALKAERINILAPVPGKSSVGVEVPNLVKTKVIMRDLLESDEWRNSKARIPLALGKDVYGHPIVADLAEMPHLLIAGSTGSGKSVCINSIIASLLYKFSPDQLRFVMIDPKVVELQQYNVLPHLVVPVVNDPKKVILALRWVVNEMEKRYQIFARVGVRNIGSFNSRPKNKPAPQPEPELPLMARKEKVEPGADGFAVEVDEEIVVPREDDIIIPEKLSYIVVIIDELADLMLVAPADVEMAIARITQMARAAGIHCIVATQRPSVDVITGVIKANIPARIAFQVAAKVDSRTILDAMGADKLLGKGDMLYLPPGSAKLIRAQGALITDQELQGIVEFIAKQAKPSYEVEIHQQLSKASSSLGEESGIDEDEDIIQQCIEVIRSEQKASVSLLQRRLRLGYGRAARIMDELENRGIVGPSNGAEPREILIDLDGGGADGKGQGLS
jgi:S-DNA-T family DNA segregation ATPase FtsK/SpoIIIE